MNENAKESEPQVMRSNGGWYVGTTWDERNSQGDLIWSEPCDRLSGYFDLK